MKKFAFIILFVFAVSSAFAQKYTSEKTSVVFFSKATIEDITASNAKSTSIINAETNDIAFIIPITDFVFKKKLMQEHFNEKYMETEKFPKATFQGKLSGFSPKATGSQNAVAKGKMTVHGVTKDVEIPGTIEVKGGKIILNTKFMIKLADYNVSIPTAFFTRIAESVEVTAEFTYKPQ